MIASRVVTALSVAAAGIAARGAAQDFSLRAVSTRPDAVSGGDVLVEVRAPERTRWTVELQGRDLTAAFRPGVGFTGRVGLVTGLAVGPNVITLRSGGRVRATLEVANHPLTGPIFSGPHQTPFVCRTAASGLGAPVDRDCSAPTIVRYYYKSTGTPDSSRAADSSFGRLEPGFRAYDTQSPPADVAKVVTSEGRTVDFVIRREVGVINRAVYEIQLLQRPDAPMPTPWARPENGWNGRLVYQFHPGCAPGFRQGALTTRLGSIQEPLLSQGYALATSTLNDFGNDCNDRISAETLAMVKEHFIEELGLPVHTIGWGGSGGAMQVQLIAQNYPGLLDGIIPMASFPDVLTFIQSTSDCLLLDHAFRSASRSWTTAQKTAVYGFASWSLCGFLATVPRLRVGDPTVCDPVIPKALVYDPRANPKGARCDLFDNEVNVYGRDPRTGFARRPLDNVGVQYGLAAFNRGVIDAEQFVELNERIGGFDGDGDFVPARTEADSETVSLAYRRGLVLTGGGGLSQLPILDWRPYSDDLGRRDGHARYLSFVSRARLIGATGSAANQVMVVGPREAWFDWFGDFWAPIGDLVPMMDRWLDNIAVDRRPSSIAARIARGRPRELEEGCITAGGERIAEQAIYDAPGRCNELYPAFGDPRIVAGAPISNDVIKCALKPLARADYPRGLSDVQAERLRRAFPDGVCDYTRPGVGKQVTRETWQRF
jgi:hypothetical protein